MVLNQTEDSLVPRQGLGNNYQIVMSSEWQPGLDLVSQCLSADIHRRWEIERRCNNILTNSEYIMCSILKQIRHLCNQSSVYCLEKQCTLKVIDVWMIKKWQLTDLWMRGGPNDKRMNEKPMRSSCMRKVPTDEIDEIGLILMRMEQHECKMHKVTDTWVMWWRWWLVRLIEWAWSPCLTWQIRQGSSEEEGSCRTSRYGRRLANTQITQLRCGMLRPITVDRPKEHGCDCKWQVKEGWIRVVALLRLWGYNNGVSNVSLLVQQQGVLEGSEGAEQYANYPSYRNLIDDRNNR